MSITSFENSAMKASFSLSSLQASETPEKSVKPRMYNSLTKNRKENHWRRSWGSTASDHKDEFWSALQANYNYIMDNNLIDNCQEANGELSKELFISTWSLGEFYMQFSELYSWLNSVQEAIYGREENIADKALRAECMNTVLQKSSLWQLFNDQAVQLIKLYPEVQEEVNWRVTHLNAKWDSILSILGPSDCGRCEQETCLDIDHEVKCLRKWIKNMELCLQPLDFRTRFTKYEIETKSLELKVLHRDIENHGKIVGSVVKLCKRTDASCNTLNNRRVANGLERRYHLLYLRSLEWQCYIESLTKKNIYRNSSAFSDSDECDGEPVSKYPRLSGKSSSNGTSDGSYVEDDIDDNQKGEGISGHGMNNETCNGNSTQRNGDTVKYKDYTVLGEDTSQFTKSNRKAPNLATYYFKHEDTDSDMERIEQLKNLHTEEHTSVEETSEDEWTYAKVDQVEESPKSQDRNSSKAFIDRLIEEAEELVSPDKVKIRGTMITPINKISRVKEWLDMEKPFDSCDASGEDEEHESQTSEELNESIATYRAMHESGSQDTSFAELDTTEVSPKTPVLRQRSHLKPSRPWSVSCISQLKVNKGIPSLSISESALYELTCTPNNNLRNSDNNMRKLGNNSTSSTMEESGAVPLEERSVSARRKRLKFKKKSYRKSESAVSNPNFMINSRNTGALTKSGSFSGCSNRVSTNERHTSSDPSALNLGQYGNNETSTTSGADSDEDRNRRVLAFRIGAKASYLNFNARDNSPGKNSLNNAEEQSSSLSEQAWDSYQEKYLSEAYSEAHDSDAARRLLEFGEDYRNYLDSQSDWSQSTNPEFSPIFGRKIIPAYSNNLDSDDEMENMRQLLQQSREQLDCTKDVYMKQFKMGLKDYLLSNDIGEMLSTCDRHVHLLNMIEQSPEEYSLDSTYRDETAVLLVNWQFLRADVLKMQSYRDIQKEIFVLKNELSRMTVPDAGDSLAVASVDDLSRDVEFYTAGLFEVVEFKKKLLALNNIVQGFIAENVEYAGSSLKSDISDLYAMWHDHHGCAKERVARLKTLLQNWQILESRLEQLQGDLREDEQTLVLLDTALQGGTFSNQMATVVRDVAKLLSERKSNQQGRGIPELFTEGGSLSDSGISDEGSEHDLGERERRLAAIRRLVRQMETVMAPDCNARVKMAGRLAAAEEELKALQKRCRSLIVRTAACSVSPPSEQSGSLGDLAVADDAGGDPSPAPEDSSWFKRVLRASLPFHVALIALLCLACLLESNCCDNMNNFSMSLTPQLRYIRGPPPV